MLANIGWLAVGDILHKPLSIAGWAGAILIVSTAAASELLE